MMNLTVVELKKALKELNVTGYSRLNKAELQQKLAYELSKQETPQTNEKETTQMKNTLTFNPMQMKTSNNITRGNMNKRNLAPSEKQLKYFEALKRNYAFPETVTTFKANNMAHMSKALDRMNQMIHNKEVHPVPEEQVKQSLRQMRTTTRTTSNNRQQVAATTTKETATKTEQPKRTGLLAFIARLFK